MAACRDSPVGEHVKQIVEPEERGTFYVSWARHSILSVAIASGHLPARYATVICGQSVNEVSSDGRHGILSIERFCKRQVFLPSWYIRVVRPLRETTDTG